MVHIYTGDGKGKTTSVVGLAVRALGHGLRVCYIYFHKDPDKHGYTEIKNLEKLGAKVFGFAKSHCFLDKDTSKETLQKQVKEGVDFIKSTIFSSGYNLLIIDEIIISVRDGFLVEKDLLDLINGKPDNLELVITGRGATSNMIELADYVSNITKIKHPFDRKITSREGIEY